MVTRGSKESDGLLDRTAEADDFDLVAFGKRSGEVHRGADGSADSVGIVQQKGDLHLARSSQVLLENGIRNAPF